MKPFNLEEYLTNPSKKVVTREGKPVRIICTNRLSESYPVLALVTDGYDEQCYSYTTFGKLDRHQNIDCELDLFFAPEKHEGWVNVYMNCNERSLGNLYSSKEDALEVAKLYDTYVTTVKIEWEE